MFFPLRIFKRTTVLSVICVTTFSFSALAQDADFGDLPPQPTQSTIPEQEMPVVKNEPNDISLGETPSIAEAIKAVDGEVVQQPSDPLDDLMPEPVMAEQENVMPQPVAIPHSGTYYDSNSIGPSSLGASAGPRKVDPRYEPASRFVVVKRNARSSSRQASIVAAQRALKLGRYSSALELYEQLYKKNPKNKQILMGLAVAQQYSGFNESAIATYEELLKIDPKNSGGMVNLMGLLESRQPKVAMRKLQTLWNKNNRNPVVAAQLGLVYAKLGDYQAANKYLGIATALEPSNALHYYNLAVVMDQAQSH